MDLLDADLGAGFGVLRTVSIAFAALSGVVVMGVESVAGWAAAVGVLAGGFAVPAVALVVNAWTR